MNALNAIIHFDYAPKHSANNSWTRRLIKIRREKWLGMNPEINGLYLREKERARIIEYVIHIYIEIPDYLSKIYQWSMSMMTLYLPLKHAQNTSRGVIEYPYSVIAQPPECPHIYPKFATQKPQYRQHRQWMTNIKKKRPKSK